MGTVLSKTEVLESFNRILASYNGITSISRSFDLYNLGWR
jgi:hypothetical protein